MILAFLAVPVFIVATIVNGLAAWKNGPHRRGGQHFGPMMIFILIAAISLWNAIGYSLLVLNFFPDLSPPLSVALLRPSNLFTGFVFTVIPSYLFTVSEESVKSERIEEALTKSRECQEKLKYVENRLLNQEQAVEIYEFSYKTMKSKYDDLLKEYNALKNQE